MDTGGNLRDEPSGSGPAAGWYPDPHGGPPRYWDGVRWAAPPPPGYPPGYPPGQYGMPYGWRPADIPDEESAGRRAGVALWCGVVAYGVTAVAQAIVFSSFVEQFTKNLSTTTRGGRTVSTAPTMSTSYVAASGLSQLASLAVLVVGVLFLVWFHKALTNAQSLGLPARRTPGWGVAGFLIPIVNFWFPYQSACDLFPPGHPDRKVVGRWWAFWLSAQFSIYLVIGLAFVSLATGLAASVLTITLYALAAAAGREVIARSAALHRDLAGAAVPTTPASPASPGGPGGRGGSSDPWGSSDPRGPIA